MAEFCLECFNKINETSDDESEYIMSDNLELCEECGEWKSVVVCTRSEYYLQKFRFFIFPFKIIFLLLYFLWRFFIIPYTIYRNYKTKIDASD